MTNEVNTINFSINIENLRLDLESIIKNEVNRRVKKQLAKALEEEKIALRKEYEEKMPVISLGGRRKGNTYRLLLFAQLLASGKPNRNIIVVSHTEAYARTLQIKVADMANVAFYHSVKLDYSRVLKYENGSRIHFLGRTMYESSYTKGLSDSIFLFDDSFYI